MTETQKTSPKDVFLHLLSILWLYVSIIAFGNLVFQIINIYFPDTLSYDYGSYANEYLKWPLSVLVVVFPLYIAFSYHVNKDAITNPVKREMRVRKWLIYLTLSLAAVVISGDLISLIYTYLSGEITTRFMLKVLTVFAIAVSVFGYYFWNLKEKEMATQNMKMKLFVYAVIAMVVGFIIAGFVMAGSPQSARLKRFDDRRVNELQSIQNEIILYYQSKQKLPESLDLLTYSISGFKVPVDPETGVAYEYVAGGKLEFDLCAVFSTSNQNANVASGDTRPQPAYPSYNDPNDNWLHDKGRICFERIIDPDRHPFFNDPKIKGIK